MRLWLALAFALIAAVTAVAITVVFSARSEKALRANAEDLAVGGTIQTANTFTAVIKTGEAQDLAEEIASRRRMSVFVFAAAGNKVAAAHAKGITLSSIPQHRVAIREALSGRRYIAPLERRRATLVAEPIPRVGGAVITYSSRPELAAQLGIVHEQIVQAALWASLVGALAGLLVAMLIARRLRRIVAAASAIESGSFETTLKPWFKDELGTLAETIDRMRLRLRDSFARLGSERDRLRRLLERLHDGVVAIEPDLSVEFCNSAAKRLLGQRDLGEGDQLPDWGDGALRRIAESLFKRRAKIVQETLALAGDSSYTVVGIPPRGRSKTAVLVLTDVSVRERRERAEREFVANAAHELRTPLATIAGSIQVLQAGAKDDAEERERFLGHIERETARLSRLSRALLVLARAQTREEAPRLAAVQMEPLLEAIAADARPSDGVAVEVRCAPGLEVLAEQDLVEQALSNLVANAVENTDEGKVVISARPVSGSAVAVEVSDTGRGIPKERQERIFDRFYRADGRDPRNFGLGLAIVREAVTALGGRVELQSEPGSGTTVRVTLARGKSEAA